VYIFWLGPSEIPFSKNSLDDRVRDVFIAPLTHPDQPRSGVNTRHLVGTSVGKAERAFFISEDRWS
jgi:hypothetical protein